MQDNLALVLEIDSNAGADYRLNLAQAPVRFDLVAHDGAYFEKRLRHGLNVADQV